MVNYSRVSENSQEKRINSLAEVKKWRDFYAPLDYGAYWQKKGKERERRMISKENVGDVSFWPGASSIKVKRDRNEEGVTSGGGIRGPIIGFSEASRRNLKKKLGKVRKDVVPVLVGRTQPNDFDNGQWKKWNKRYMERFRYRFPDAGVLVKEEFQERGALHSHDLVWNVNIDDLYEFCYKNWFEVVSSGDAEHEIHGVEIEEVKSWGGMKNYMAKYIGKKGEDNENWDHVGRYWSFYGCIPWAEEVVESVTFRQAVQMIRYLRKNNKIYSREYLSLELQVDDAEYWYKRKDDLFRCDWPRYYRKSKGN